MRLRPLGELTALPQTLQLDLGEGNREGEWKALGRRQEWKGKGRGIQIGVSLQHWLREIDAP